MATGIITQEGILGNEKEDALQSIVKKYREKAWKQLLDENDALDAKVDAIKKAAKKAGKADKQDEARDLLGILK